MEKVNILEKAKKFSEIWTPKIIGELNNQHVKIAYFEGEFGWHDHQDEDELFFVINGSIEIELEENTITLNEGEFFIVPKGVRHNPKAEFKSLVMLLEPTSTINTGNEVTEFTQKKLEHI